MSVAFVDQDQSPKQESISRRHWISNVLPRIAGCGKTLNYSAKKLALALDFVNVQSAEVMLPVENDEHKKF